MKKSMKKKGFITIIFLIIGVATGFTQTKLTAQEIFAKTVGIMSNPKGVEASFSVGSSGYRGNGRIISLGPKYRVILPEVEVWYNGKSLYTYNKNTEETTVVTPTIEELAESNPMSYIGGASKNYNVAISTVKKTGKHVLELTPKQKGGEIKRVTLTVRQKDYVPEKIVIEPISGHPITAEISSFKIGITASSTEFEYPKAKYPKVEIIDLR